MPQIRVYEKAQDDYAARFPDGLAESCVADVVRARSFLDEGEAMTTLQERLETGISVRVEGRGKDLRVVATGGEEVELTLARNKPKFAPHDLDPTREGFASNPQWLF